MVISTKKNKKNGSRTKKKFMKTSLKKKSKFKTKSRKYLNKTNKIMIGGSFYNNMYTKFTNNYSTEIPSIIEYVKTTGIDSNKTYNHSKITIEFKKELEEAIKIEGTKSVEGKYLQIPVNHELRIIDKIFYDLYSDDLQLIYIFKNIFIDDITKYLEEKRFIIKNEDYVQILTIKKNPNINVSYGPYNKSKDIKKILDKYNKLMNDVNTLYISRVFTVLTEQEVEVIMTNLNKSSGNNNNLLPAEEEMFQPVKTPSQPVKTSSQLESSFGFNSPNTSTLVSSNPVPAPEPLERKSSLGNYGFGQPSIKPTAKEILTQAETDFGFNE
jgi:hypothetical protein